MPTQSWILGLTGASGTVYARRLVRALTEYVPDLVGTMIMRFLDRMGPDVDLAPRWKVDVPTTRGTRHGEAARV